MTIGFCLQRLLQGVICRLAAGYLWDRKLALIQMAFGMVLVPLNVVGLAFSKPTCQMEIHYRDNCA